MPYHLGRDTVLAFGERSIRVTLLDNPSHLEAIDPLALGAARAAQDIEGEEGRARVLPIILHTDAAVVAQGVVAECIQLAGTAGYRTGGTLHVVVNNQIGFTTEAQEARTSRHCTGPWKAVDSAILHVNGDDPAAVCRAADIAVAWRQSQGCDAVVDLVCYRRNGHNEIDEPNFTQPLLYARIAAHPPVPRAFADELVRAGLIDAAGVAAMAEACRARLEAAYGEAPGFRRNESGFPDRPAPRGLETGVPEETLTRIAAALAAPPLASMHPRMGRILRQRTIGEAGIAWPSAEALAFGSLVLDGVPVRLSGQDVVRGAFSHRHFAVLDATTGERHVGLDCLAPDQARFEAFNSPLSEYAVLGFEYGYSLERPEALVIWEAQFGDFANGAQIVIDQFIAAAEEKWCAPSRLVLLLPHGLEGQGPEHSSARPERFLQLAARDNLNIVNPSTPANYFHLMRGQALGAPRSAARRDEPEEAATPAGRRLATRRFPPRHRVPPCDCLDAGRLRRRGADLHAARSPTTSRRSAPRAAPETSRSSGSSSSIRFPAEELVALLRQWPLRANRLRPGGAGEHGRVELARPPARSDRHRGRARAPSSDLCRPAGIALPRRRLPRRPRQGPAGARRASVRLRSGWN